MNPEAPARRRWEPLEAGRGLGRLLTFDTRWAQGFDLSAAGFRRSFYGPLMALPFYLFHTALVQATQVGQPISAEGLGAAAGEHLADAFGYVLLVFLIARPLGVGAGFLAFATVVNWAALYLNAALATASLLLMLGPEGLTVFSIAYLCVLTGSLLLVWRAARETLTREAAPLVLLVLLSVGWSVAVDQLATWLSARL